MADKTPKAGNDPLAYQDETAGEKQYDAVIDQVADAKEEGRKEADRMMAERQAHGFAPPLDPSDPRPREVKEQDVKEALGVDPHIHTTAKEMDLGKDVKHQAKSSAEVAAEMERLRSGPGLIQGEVRDVTINGTRYRVPTGREVSMPEGVREVIEQADRPVRTAQMLGGTDGTPTVDLTKD